MKVTNTRSGFSAVELVIIVIVLAIAVGLGYVFLNRPTDKSVQTSTVSTPAEAAAETSSIKNDLDSVNVDASLDTTDIDTALE